MIFFVLLITCFIIVFSNVLFYTLSLLLISSTLLIWIVTFNIISILMLFLILIVYVGAIMIFIGYICAVCPNFILSPSYNYFSFVFVTLFLCFIFSSPNINILQSPNHGMLLDFFFSSWGLFFFVVVVFILFLTLLIVTSQYLSPQAPFRSVN